MTRGDKDKTPEEQQESAAARVSARNARHRARQADASAENRAEGKTAKGAGKNRWGEKGNPVSPGKRGGRTDR